MGAQRILGIDPGTATVGYGVIDCPTKETFRWIASGVIQTPRHLSAGERLAIIRADVLSLIDEHQPDCVAVEAIFFFKNAKTVIPVAQARGVILEAAATRQTTAFEYTPMQVKLNLTGFGRAEKRDVQEAVSRLLKLPEIIKPDDAADAVAIAICHARLSLAAEQSSRPSPASA